MTDPEQLRQERRVVPLAGLSVGDGREAVVAGRQAAER